MGIIRHSPTTSVVTNIEFSGKFLICLIFLRKFPESIMYDQLICITGFRWWSKNSDAFSVGVAKIKGRPGLLKAFFKFCVKNRLLKFSGVLIVIQDVFHILF